MEKSKPVKILFIEDEPKILELYTLKFQNEGFFVIQAKHGKEGLKLAKKEKPDLILLDIILPKMDGFEVLKKIKLDKSTANIPVVLLTNLGEHRDMQEGRRLGALDYLVKANYTPAEVVKKVEAYLEKL